VRVEHRDEEVLLGEHGLRHRSIDLVRGINEVSATSGEARHELPAAREDLRVTSGDAEAGVVESRCVAGLEPDDAEVVDVERNARELEVGVAVAVGVGAECGAGLEDGRDLRARGSVEREEESADCDEKARPHLDSRMRLFQLMPQP
jgi:hypothetical protein